MNRFNLTFAGLLWFAIAFFCLGLLAAAKLTGCSTFHI